MRPALLLVVGAILLPSCNGTEGPLLTFSSDDEDGAGGADNGDDSPPWTGDLAEPSSFQIQLSGSVATSQDAELFVIDLHTPQDTVFDELEAAGRVVACYFSSGSYEPWRPDASDFPDEVKGNTLVDYPQEQWLDVTSGVVIDLMMQRIDTARERGCDAVYPSLVRPDAEESGFSVSDDDFLQFARVLADGSHARGMAALFAGTEALDESALFYDGAVVLGCLAAGTCDSWRSYRSSGRGVFSVELGDADNPGPSCEGAAALGWPTIVKQGDFGSFRYPCP